MLYPFNRSQSPAPQTIQAFLQGSEDAFAALYKRFLGPITKYVGGKIRDTELRDDLVQEIFLKVVRARGTYNPAHQFSTWLWTIARNVVIDHLRKETPEPLDGDAVEEVACSRPCIETLLSFRENRRRLWKLLKKLTFLQRKVLFMRIIRQLSYEEIAKQLGMSLDAVKCLVYRSRQILIREMQSCVTLG